MVKPNLVPLMICLGFILYQVSQSHGWGKSPKAGWKQVDPPVHPSQMSTYPTTQNAGRAHALVPTYHQYPQGRTFGCQFGSKPYFVKTATIFDPVYGDPVLPMEFNTAKDFITFLNNIRVPYSKVKYNHVWTNIPAFYDFYDEYKTKSYNGSLSNFFNKFKPRFHPAQERSTVAVDLLDRLVRTFPGTSRSVHLVTCHVNAREDLLRTLKIDDTEKTVAKSRKSQVPPRTFIHRHVAALLRIRISGRLGYVLMDPALLEEPIVIMEDGQHPLMNKLQFSEFVLRYPDYIVFKNTYDQKNIYYIGKPYCSFLMTTNKLDILMDTRKRMEYSHLAGNSANTASFVFDVTQRQPSFKMSLHTTSAYSGEISIPFGSRQSPKTDLIYKTVLNTINYPGIENVLSKAETIAKDKEFIKKLVELYSYYYNQIYGNSQFFGPNQSNGNNPFHSPNQIYGNNHFYDSNQMYGNNKFYGNNQIYGNTQANDNKQTPYDFKQIFEKSKLKKIPSLKIPPPGGVQSRSIPGLYSPARRSEWTYYHD